MSVATSARPCSGVTPGRNRPTMYSQRAWRPLPMSSAVRTLDGIQTSTSADGKAKPAGITPTTV